jgi:hypothetical protein
VPYLAMEQESINEFLLYWLVANKQKAMNILGYNKEDVEAELSKLSQCGSYFVTFGKGKAFATYRI